MSKTSFPERWSVVESLPEGGQGRIYVVKDLRNPTGPLCVLKRLKSLKRIGRFADEIDAVKSLDHPHIIRFVDASLEGDKPFLVTEYCSGGELDAEKLEGKSILEKLRLFKNILGALSHAHKKGVIHRDIKPPNILFREDGMLVIADFGICFLTDKGLERMTEVQEQVGARYYMAPELAEGVVIDVKATADVYSLGKLLYWMLSGRIFDRERYDQPGWTLRTGEGTDPAILLIYDQIFPKTIVEDPAQRFAEAADLEIAVAEIIEMLEKQGRYLDANVPSDCLFCGKGKYLKQAMVPAQIISEPYNPRMGQTPRTYNLNYENKFGLGPSNAISLPEGNIVQGSYDCFLVLKCNYCCNLQNFHFDGNSAYNWKGAKFKIPDAGFFAGS